MLKHFTVLIFRVWRNSEEKVLLESQDVSGTIAEQLGNGPKAVFQVAGDSAYPLSPFVLKPYPVCH